MGQKGVRQEEKELEHGWGTCQKDAFTGLKNESGNAKIISHLLYFRTDDAYLTITKKIVPLWYVFQKHCKLCNDKNFQNILKTSWN